MSIPCPACGTVPPDDYCADCDIIVSHDKCDECEEVTAIDLGDLCVYCGEDTSYGSGKFVNRIPADNTVEVVFEGPHSADLEVTGWMCDECQPREWTCDGCLDLVPDGAGHYVNDMRVCQNCVDKITAVN